MKIKNKYKNNINIYLLFMKYIDNTVQMFLLSYADIYLIKYTVKTIILWNIITNWNNTFFIVTYFKM